MAKNSVHLSVPVTVAFRIIDGEWYCTALEFSILGTGNSRDAALSETRELLEEYVEAVLLEAKSGPVEFFHPSPPAEWNTNDIENFRVELKVQYDGAQLDQSVIRNIIALVSTMESLGERANIEQLAFDLIPS